jgi:hypothetical protein
MLGGIVPYLESEQLGGLNTLNLNRRCDWLERMEEVITIKRVDITRVKIEINHIIIAVIEMVGTSKIERMIEVHRLSDRLVVIIVNSPIISRIVPINRLYKRGKAR